MSPERLQLPLEALPHAMRLTHSLPSPSPPHLLPLPPSHTTFTRMSPERLQLPLEALPHAIDSSEQKNVMLAYRERFDKFGDLIRCHGPPCPDFASCGSAYPNVHACWNPLLDAPLLLPARAPLNCPKKVNLKKPRVAWQNHDKTCSHPRDFNPREPSAMQVFRLHDVMVTHKGFVFNATHRYVHQGCKRFNPFSYPQGQKVHRIKLAFDWGYTQGNNFYHFLVEAIPSFFVAAAALPNLRDIPIIAERFQWDLYDSIGRIFIGVNRTDMRALPATDGDLFHVDTLYVPMLQECGAPNKALWMELRRHHLLHPQGLPLFRPDFSYHYRPALSYQQLTHLSPDLVVVLAQRPSGKRSFTNAEEVKEAVLAAFPAERVVVFDGSLQLMQGALLALHGVWSGSEAPWEKRGSSLRPLLSAAHPPPPDWVVVLAQWPSGKRSFTNSEEVKEALLAAFPPERVVVFDGSLQLMQAHHSPLLPPPPPLPLLPPPTRLLPIWSRLPPRFCPLLISHPLPQPFFPIPAALSSNSAVSNLVFLIHPTPPLFTPHSPPPPSPLFPLHSPPPPAPLAQPPHSAPPPAPLSPPNHTAPLLPHFHSA
ncbi:unnamed protein product [Closterium sp. Naga37s-1]|nr:unnamed protein product [Closterium sp. Naga37s-1]